MAERDRSTNNTKDVFILSFVVLLIVVLASVSLMISIRDSNHPIDVHDTTVSSDGSKITELDTEYGYGDTDGLAFVASVYNEGPFMYGEDHWESTTYSMHYDGTLEVTSTYSLSAERTNISYISEEDFNTIMNLAEKVMDEKPYEDMDYSDTMDGSTCGFSIYDTNGEETHIYGGYIYGIDDLESIVDILYRIDSLRDAY